MSRKGTDTETVLLQVMEYRGPGIRCGTCSHFVPDDCSGDMNAKSAHCTLNPAIDLPVDEGGWCKFYQPKGAPSAQPNPEHTCYDP